MNIIGIDPGKLGGIALIRTNGRVARHIKVPATERDILANIAPDETEIPLKAYIERVASSPQMGVKSAFTFGQGYGFLRGCLTSLSIPFEEVTPAKWQRALGCLSKGDKNVTKAKAQQLFPGLRITHATADALLIAEYGRRKENGTL